MLNQPKSSGELAYQLSQARKGIDIKKPAAVKENDLSHLRPIDRLTAARKAEAKLAADNPAPTSPGGELVWVNGVCMGWLSYE